MHQYSYLSFLQTPCLAPPTCSHTLAIDRDICDHTYRGEYFPKWNRLTLAMHMSKKVLQCHKYLAQFPSYGFGWKKYWSIVSFDGFIFSFETWHHHCVLLSPNLLMMVWLVLVLSSQLSFSQFQDSVASAPS